MIKKHERYNREMEQQDKIEIDETKKPIQKSRHDKGSRANVQNYIPLDMINFDYDTKGSVLASGRRSNALYNSSEKIARGSML